MVVAVPIINIKEYFLLCYFCFVVFFCDESIAVKFHQLRDDMRTYVRVGTDLTHLTKHSWWLFFVFCDDRLNMRLASLFRHSTEVLDNS